MGGFFTDWILLAWFVAVALVALAVAVIVYAVWLPIYAVQQLRAGESFRWHSALRFGIGDRSRSDQKQPLPAEYV